MGLFYVCRIVCSVVEYLSCDGSWQNDLVGARVFVRHSDAKARADALSGGVFEPSFIPATAAA